MWTIYSPFYNFKLESSFLFLGFGLMQSNLTIILFSEKKKKKLIIILKNLTTIPDPCPCMA